MFPETSRSPRCILPPVIYEVPETSPSLSSASLITLLFTVPFAARSFSVSYATTPAGSFRSVHFLLFSQLPPASDSWCSLNAITPASSSSSFFLSLLANLFSKTTRPFSLFPRSFRPSFSAGKNSGALTIPGRQTRPAYSSRA